jgi:hypothetical protein
MPYQGAAPIRVKSEKILFCHSREGGNPSWFSRRMDSCLRRYYVCKLKI